MNNTEYVVLSNLVLSCLVLHNNQQTSFVEYNANGCGSGLWHATCDRRYLAS